MSMFDTQLLMLAVKVTESASLEAYKLIGCGNETEVDRCAVESMRNNLNKLDIEGTVVIGEGERDEAPMLYIGEKLGTGNGPKVDIAVDPVEGTTILAEAGQNSLSVLAFSEEGGMLNAPDVYMEKIAIGFNFSEPLISLSLSVKENLKNVALARQKSVSDLMVSVLKRKRHEELIYKIREAGAKVQLIQDGDISAIMSLAMSNSYIDLYIGPGGAPEGVLAASALKTMGGQICSRLILDSQDLQKRANRMGIVDFNKQYYLNDLIHSDTIFVATGITDGNILEGVHSTKSWQIAHSIAMNSKTKTLKWIKSQYYL